MILILRYNQTWNLISGNTQSIPSDVFPLIPNGIIFFHAGNAFFVTSSTAFVIDIGSLFFSYPKELYTVAVPYVTIETSMLYVFSKWFFISSIVMGPFMSILSHFVNSTFNKKITSRNSFDRSTHNLIKFFVYDLNWWQGIIEHPKR